MYVGMLVFVFVFSAGFVGCASSHSYSRVTLNVSSAVGFIGLFGIAVHNGLVVIAQTWALMSEGMTFEYALRQASIGRVRPKLMTATCAMLGLLPLVILRARTASSNRRWPS